MRGQGGYPPQKSRDQCTRVRECLHGASGLSRAGGESGELMIRLQWQAVRGIPGAGPAGGTKEHRGGEEGGRKGAAHPTET